MALKEVSIWDNRLQAVLDAIGHVKTGLPFVAETDRRETFENLLDCLRLFGEKQYNFFRDRFQANPPTLETTSKLVAEYAVQQTIDQIMFDLTIIQRARNQRIISIITASERETLARADILAYKALLPAIRAKLIPNTTAITYFQKSPSVRIIPYADVALIGIPFTCLKTQENARDFLAIPHEVGHHVFWHGRKHGVSLKAHLRSSLPDDFPAWALNWLEEIFADVYGAYVAGPAIAYDFQELLFNNLDFAEDDGEHPIAVIRPYIYIETLKRIKDQDDKSIFKNAPSLLANNWDTWRSERYNLDTVQPNGETNALPIAQVQKHLEDAIDIILDKTGLRFPQTDDLYNPWSSDSQVGADIKNLYTQFFDETLDPLPKTIQGNTPEITKNDTELEIAEVGRHVIAGNAINSNKWNVGETRAIWFEFLTQPDLEQIQLPANIWSNLFTNGGWASGGPEGDDNPG